MVKVKYSGLLLVSLIKSRGFMLPRELAVLAIVV